MTARTDRRTLVLLRHGRTAWNVEQRGQGHADVPLDDIGHAQAAAVAPRLAGLGPVRIWSSDLARARVTADAVAGACGLSVTTDERLREVDLGDRTGLTLAEFTQKMPEEHAAFLRGEFGAVPGAETTLRVAERMAAAISDAAAALAPGECGVLVSHGASLRVGVLAVLGLPAAAAVALQGMDNCGWTVLDDSGPGGTWRLVAWNRSLG